MDVKITKQVKPFGLWKHSNYGSLHMYKIELLN